MGCRYGDFWALKDVSLAIKAGEKVALLGPNGAGKSTLLRCMVGLQEPHEGQLGIQGRPPKSLKARLGTAYLPESNPLPQVFRVSEYLIDRCRFYGRKPKEMDEVLEAVGLTERKRDLIQALSHGMKQRLGLAATLLTGASLLILDEPTSGLDPQQVNQIRDLLKGLENKTLLMSTHLFSDAEAVCDRALILNAGVLSYDGPAKNLDAKFREALS
jgi:ABC-2 type transport system ATP-binding protein